MSVMHELSSEKKEPAKVILVVEDDEDIGELIVQTIQTETAHQIALVTDGGQALKFVEDIRPQLLILDYLLPNMNGLQLYDQIHATEGLRHIPLFFISANVPQKELEKRHLKCIKKPFELDELLLMVEKMLEA